MPATLSRSLRRLHRLAESAVVTTGDERALIVKTILKILDECSDRDYDIAMTEPLNAKLVAAGVEFEDVFETCEESGDAPT